MVSSGGAGAPAEASAEAAPAIDLEAFAKEPSTEEESQERDTAPEEPVRRDSKMMSYEEAMALPIEIGEATSEGGEAQLSANDVARVMDGHLDEMYDECIRKEFERGNELGTVTIDLAIRGKDGMILGTTIDPGRRRFKTCLESYFEDLRFPKFASPRMGARHRFHTS